MDDKIEKISDSEMFAVSGGYETGAKVAGVTTPLSSFNPDDPEKIDDEDKERIKPIIGITPIIGGDE